MIHRILALLDQQEPQPVQMGLWERAMPSPRMQASISILAVIIAGCLAASCLAGWYWHADWRRSWDTLQVIFASPDAFRDWVAEVGVWTPVVFFLVMAAQVIVAPIPGGVLPPVAAAAFGPEAGIALVIAGTAVGSTVVFAFARGWGRPLVSRIVGQAALDRYAGLVTAHGGLWLFLVYALPLLPDDALTAAAGLSRISFRRFLVLSTLGRLPGMVMSIYAASLLFAGPLWVGLAVAIVLAAVVILAFRYRAQVETWLLCRVSRLCQKSRG
jgi:uncharacterized membrane protein YdjX (TVP38/TMEM64 family)